jgi:autotransporter-associated beta strand protein
MSTRRKLTTWAGALAIMGGLLAGGPAGAAWQTYDATTQNYTNTANWVGGVVDDVFNSSSTAWAQTINVTANRTLPAGLSITRNPASAAAGNVVFQGSGGDRTFTLGGDVSFTGNNANSKLVQLGANTAGSRLILDLGSQTRAFNVSTSSASRSFGFFVFGPITGSGGLTKAGDGMLGFFGTNTHTFTGPLTITRGLVFLTDKVHLATPSVILRNRLSSLTSWPTTYYSVSILASSSLGVPWYDGAYWLTANRLSPATTLTMDGGLFGQSQLNGTADISTERVANLVLVDGLAQIDATTKSLSGKNVSFTIDNLSRPHHAPMSFSAADSGTYGTTGFGTGAGKFTVAIGNYNASWSKGGILPFAVIGNVGGSYSELDAVYAPAAYDAGGYVKAATVTPRANLAAGLPGENVKIAPAANDTSVGNGVTVTNNALLIAPTAAVNLGASGNAGTVKLTSGQLAFSPSGKNMTTYVTFDMNGEHAYVFHAYTWGTITFSGPISNASGATFASCNANGGSAGRISLSAAAGWSGETTIASGYVYMDHANGLPSGSRVNIASGAALDGPGADTIFGSLAGAGAVKIENTRTLAIGADNTDSEFSGQIHQAGTGAFTKQGTGRLTLSGQGYYTGATTVSGGGFVINGSLAASANTVTVQNSAYLGGTGTIARAVTVNSGGRLTAGLTNSVGTLNIASNLNLKAGAILDVQLAGGGVCDTIMVGRAADLNSGGGAGSTLQLTALGTLKGGETYTIVRAGSPIVNTFANGASLTAGGCKLAVNYAGGTGNKDIVLTVLPQGTAISIR